MRPVLVAALTWWYGARCCVGMVVWGWVSVRVPLSAVSRRTTTTPSTPYPTLAKGPGGKQLTATGCACEQMQGNTEQEVVMGVPVIREHPKQRSRLGIN